VRPILRQTSKLYQLGESVELSRSRAAIFGDSFDSFTLCSIASKGIEGQTPGGTGTGTGAGGGSSSGTGAVAGTETAAGSGTAGVGNALPWLYPTADFRNFDKFGAIALPAIGAGFTSVLSFVVDNGRNGKITQIGIDFVQNGGAAWTQGTAVATLLFRITTNGKPFKDYESFAFSPGAVSAPTPINGLMLKENDTIQVWVSNISIVVSTQSIAARLLGYNFSKNLMPKILGLQ
jgi:hypothetical protein